MASKKKTVETVKKAAAKKTGKSAKSNSSNTSARKTVAAPKSKHLKKAEAAPKVIAKKKASHPEKKDKESIVKKAIVKKTKEAPVKKTARAVIAKGKTSAKKETVHKSASKEKIAVQPAAKISHAPKSEDHKKGVLEVHHEKAHHNHTPVIAKTITRKEPGSAKPKFIYRPEPSILDNPEENNTPRKRYSDNELQEFKELIQRKLEAAKKELIYLQGLITRKDEAGTDDTENKYMGVEDGSGTMEREQLSQLASRQIQYIDHLEKALVRIENKTYGICRVTGKLIDKARLRAVPHATLSIEAKLANKR